MEAIAAGLKPYQKKQLHEVANGILKVYRTLVRMRYLEESWIEEGPHDVTALLPLYRRLNIDPSIIYLYSILPYVNTHNSDHLDFFQGGSFADFRQKSDVEQGRDPMGFCTEEGSMRPWMTSLSHVSNHYTAILYDARRHVVGLYPQLECGSSDPNIFEMWTDVTVDEEDEHWDPMRDGKDNDNSERDGGLSEDGHDAKRRKKDMNDNDGSVTTNENENDGGEDDGHDDGDDDDEYDEPEGENNWDEMDSRPAPNVLRDMVVWFENLTELPGGGEYSGGEWDADVIKPLYQKHGWPDADFNGEAFLVDQARAEAFKQATWDAEEPLRKAQEVQVWVKDEDTPPMREDRKIVAEAKDLEEEWLARWRLWLAETRRDGDRQKLDEVKREAERLCPGGQCMKPGERLPWELIKLEETLGYRRDRLAEFKEEYEPIGDPVESPKDIVIQWAYAKKRVDVYQRAVDACKAEMGDVPPSPSRGLDESRLNHDRFMADHVRKLRSMEREAEGIRAWLTQAPEDAKQAREAAEAQLDSLESATDEAVGVGLDLSMGASEQHAAVVGLGLSIGNIIGTRNADDTTRPDGPTPRLSTPCRREGSAMGLTHHGVRFDRPLIMFTATQTRMSTPASPSRAIEQEALLGDRIPVVNYGAAKPDEESGATDSHSDDETSGPARLDPDCESDSNHDKSGTAHMRARLKYIFPALAIGIFLSAADQTIIVSSYGRIGSDLHGLEKVSWLATAYLTSTTAFQPLYGRLSDILGRKACLLFAYAMLGLGALFCGLAQTIDQLIAARTFAGVGAGGITTVVSILLSDIVTLEERGLWQGYVNMVFACGAGLGAPLGGIMADTINWRWAFLGQAPLCGAAIISVAMLLHLPPRHNDKLISNLGKVDFLGAGILVAALTSLLLFLDALSSGSTDGKDVYMWLFASFVLFPTFLFIETKVAREPLTPLRLLFGRDVIFAYLGNAFAISAWFGVMFYTPLLYQAVDGRGASAAGVLLLPGIISGILGGLLGGSLLKRGVLGVPRVALISLGAVVAACFSMGLVSPLLWPSSTHDGYTAIISISLGLFLGGLGNGGGMTASLVAVVANSNPDDQAAVTACSFMYRSLGTAVGLATLSLVFQRTLASELVTRMAGTGLDLDMEETLRRVQRSLEYIETLPEEARVVVKTSYGAACQSSFLFCAGLAACAVVSMSFFKDKRPRS